MKWIVSEHFCGANIFRSPFYFHIQVYNYRVILHAYDIQLHVWFYYVVFYMLSSLSFKFIMCISDSTLKERHGFTEKKLPGIIKTLHK